MSWQRESCREAEPGSEAPPRGERRRQGEAVVAHPAALSGRVGRAGTEELRGGGAGIDLGLRAAGLLDRLGAILRGHHVLDLELLLGRQRQQLVCGLLRLQRPFGALALCNDRGQGLSIRCDILDDLRLHSHGLLIGGHGRIEATACCDHLLIGTQRRGEALREKLAELLVEAGYLKPYALRLAHQLVDLPEGLSQRLQFREIDSGQVLRLIDQAVRFVLQGFDLVVDLLKRARGGQDVLTVIARIEDDEGLSRRCWQCQTEGQRTTGSDREGTRDQMLADWKFAMGGHGKTPRSGSHIFVHLKDWRQNLSGDAECNFSAIGAKV